MPRKMSDKGVAALKPRASRYSKPDPELREHWIRVSKIKDLKRSDR